MNLLVDVYESNLWEMWGNISICWGIFPPKNHGDFGKHWMSRELYPASETVHMEMIMQLLSIHDR